MAIDALLEKGEQLDAVGGDTQFETPEKLLVTDGLLVRFVGGWESSWEHFIKTPDYPRGRPYYCEGPKSDCPICALGAEMRRSEEKEQQAGGRTLGAREVIQHCALERTPAGRE